MDIFIIYSVLPSVFVANTELEEEFPLGAVTKYAGGIFVERRNRSKLIEDMKKISEVLDMGLNVVIFPEGTTSDGSAVYPFKAPFLKAAIDTETPVLPLCINYRSIDNEIVEPENKDLLFYYGEITFFEHFFRLLKTRRIDVELQALDAIEVNPKMTRKELSREAYSRISSAYTNI
jgi:1-acyl-sn-glycerol-3-phosphate acyltransferase